MKDTVNAIIEKYGIGKRLRYGLIVFGNQAEQILNFGEELNNINSLKTYISLSKRQPGEPDLQKGLEEARQLFDQRSMRPGVKSVLVVIIDKKSVSNPESVREAVKPLEEQNVKVIPVAIGQLADADELERITPNKGYLLKTERMFDADETADRIMEKVLKGD